MTKRIAIFVEGLTEQEFVIRLIQEIAGGRGIALEIRKQFKGVLSVVEIVSAQNPDFYILVANCCNEDQVKSQIRDQYNSLVGAGYALIIGLRDVYPAFTAQEVPRLQANLSAGLPQGSVPICMHLAIMEIEAWFVEELSHYQRIDPNIDLPKIVAGGFDPANGPACDLPHPALTLDKIYMTVGKRYDKKKSQIQRTVQALSYEELYVNVQTKAPSLAAFLQTLENGLFPPAIVQVPQTAVSPP